LQKRLDCSAQFGFFIVNTRERSVCYPYVHWTKWTWKLHCI